jgi:myo-inositol-1(or 4)-monophosphatase
VAPSPAELREVATAAARAAGDVLVDGLGRPMEVARKNERTSLVTAVDLAAQAEIVRVIAGHYPEHTIVGEEGTGGTADGDCTWLVDPLDGTSNYAHGVPLACTSIAVVDADGLAAGAIFEPFRAELFTAVRGGGAWLGAERLTASETATLDRALVCTGVQCDDEAATAAFAGRIDAFLEADSTYAWDLAAGALMISEAGGRIEDLGGGAVNLGAGVADVLATNGHIHDDLAALVRRPIGTAG